MAGKGIIRIYYKDSSYKSFYLHEDVTAKEVAELFGTDFLHVDKKISAHFSIHVIIDGKDIRQLKPEDRPLRVQRDLFSLKIQWNTDKNYFLFCLSEETKVRMTAKLGSGYDFGSPPQKKSDSELIVPNRLAQSSPDNLFRPLSRKLTQLKPTISSFFSGKGKSEISPRPPVPSSRSEGSDLGIGKSPTLERRNTTLGANMQGEPATAKTKQEISEHLRKMVMEEKQKLRASTHTETASSSPPKSVSSPKPLSSVSSPNPTTIRTVLEVEPKADIIVDNSDVIARKRMEEDSKSIQAVQNSYVF